MTTHEFIQQLSISKDKVPTIILFTEEQIMDVKCFCCSGPAAHTTVLGFDKTFNLGEPHVTVGVFKNLEAAVRRYTGDRPIFPGPIFLHGNSDFLHTTASSHINPFRGTPSPPIFGTDDEIALKPTTTSYSSSFPKRNIT